MSRDKNGNPGSYAYWWSQHFKFFNKQEDKIVLYDADYDVNIEPNQPSTMLPITLEMAQSAAKGPERVANSDKAGERCKTNG